MTTTVTAGDATLSIEGDQLVWTRGREWPQRLSFDDVSNPSFEPPSEYQDGRFELTSAFKDRISLPFPRERHEEFRKFAIAVDDWRRGRGKPLLPITTGLTIPGREIADVVDVITSEAGMGINLFKDIANAWRDAVGGRSKSLQGILREAREACLWELRQEARRRFADAVIGVDLDYTEFSSTLVSGGMVMVVASGTAVRLAPEVVGD
jgi:uncharacterized protein YbjQ (UPF0145 family)